MTSERATNRTSEGFSLVTGPGRTPMTRGQVNRLGRVIGTVVPGHKTAN